MARPRARRRCHCRSRQGQYTLTVQQGTNVKELPVSVTSGAVTVHHITWADTAAVAAVETGHLSVATDPAGSDVLVDGEARGVSPAHASQPSGRPAPGRGPRARHDVHAHGADRGRCHGFPLHRRQPGRDSRLDCDRVPCPGAGLRGPASDRDERYGPHHAAGRRARARARLRRGRLPRDAVRFASQPGRRRRSQWTCREPRSASMQFPGPRCSSMAPGSARRRSATSLRRSARMRSSSVIRSLASVASTPSSR